MPSYCQYQLAHAVHMLEAEFQSCSSNAAALQPERLPCDALQDDAAVYDMR